jgi:PAS domain S-box-containing protein
MSGTSNRKILYIEDDVGLARLFQRAMERAGYEVELALNGDEGIAKFREGSYALVALDHKMPGKSGLEVIRALVEPGPLPPTIMITGAGNERVAVEALKLGAADYIIKDAEGNYLELIPSVVEQTLRNQDLAAEKQRAEEALKESEQRYRALFERAGDAIFILQAEGDDVGRIVSANPSAARMHGYTVEELARRNIADLHSPDSAELFLSRISSIIDGEWIKHRCTHHRKDGSVFPVELSAGLLDIGGKRFILAIDRDITEREKSQDLHVRTQRLEAVAELAGGVAHNFNNLLQIVMGGASLIQECAGLGDLDEIKAQTDQIMRSARYGSETVKQLQSFAGVRNEPKPQTGRVFDMSKTVSQAIEMSRVWWKTIPDKDGIQITLTSSLEEGCFVLGKENELFDVSVNLIKNSAEALQKGGSINIRGYVLDGEVVFRFHDSGPGIPPENVDRIFEPFFTTKGFQRSGMGLSSSLGAVKRCGGELTVETSPEHGTTFTVVLPLAGESSPLPLTARTDKNITLNVLVIDDLEPVLNSLCRALGRVSCRITSAASGEEGLRLFKEKPFDLVICDLGMPGMNGWEVGKRIRMLCSERGLRKPPFILLTGWGGQLEETEKIEESGVDRLIEKPVDPPGLIDTIKELADFREAEQAPEN